VNAIVDFIQACAASGALFWSLLALVAAPLFAWVAVRRLAGVVKRIEHDHGTRASLAVTGAILPGITFVTASVTILITFARTGCLATVVGRVIFAIVAFLLVSSLLRAAIPARRRERSIADLLSVSLHTGIRRAGLSVLRVPSDTPFVALANHNRSAILISDVAFQTLSDEEREAAFAHELAHHRRRDPLIDGVLSFCTDLLPLPTEELVDVYLQAREFEADRIACREHDAGDLAAAILRVAAAPARAAALGGADTRARLRALLLPGDRTRRGSSALALGLLASILGSGALPIVVASLAPRCVAM
jgi:Zn-dependent protease with chaperone function